MYANACLFSNLFRYHHSCPSPSLSSHPLISQRFIVTQSVAVVLFPYSTTVQYAASPPPFPDPDARSSAAAAQTEIPSPPFLPSPCVSDFSP